MKIDIISKGAYPANVLSNFYPRPFVVDGVECASAEGFLQSLKTKDPDLQREVCALWGKQAKSFFRGKWVNVRWKLTGVLYWQGRRIRRRSEKYKRLIQRAYDAMMADETFRKALMDSGDAELTHSIGKRNPRFTVLTEGEFIDQLNRLRNELNG